MREIKIWRDPYDAGFNTCRARKVTFEEGLTVLVGCNGAGKTTMLHNIRDELFSQKIPHIRFDNLHDGGSHGISEAFNDFSGDFDLELGASMMMASEGENITTNIARFLSKNKEFWTSGWPALDKFTALFMDEEKLEARKHEHPCKERWCLMDATDSGYSIDQIVSLKAVLKDMIKRIQNDGFSPYFIISANEYELPAGEDCIDVTTGKHVKLESYEDYKKLILKTRATKDKRYEKKE